MTEKKVCLLCAEEHSERVMAKAEKEHPEWHNNPLKVLHSDWNKIFGHSYENVPEVPCVTFDIYCHGKVSVCETHLKKALRAFGIKGWTADQKDRIEYNQDTVTIDEVVMFGANVHLEQLDDGCFMLIMENKKKRWHFNIFSRSGRAMVDAKLYEEVKHG